MTTLREFLCWFEGISENIEGAPTEKQWARISQKLSELKASASNGVVGTAWVEAASARAEPAGGAHTTKWWKDQVFTALTNNETLSLDDETARDELASIPVDLNAEPMEVALRIVRTMTN